MSDLELQVEKNFSICGLSLRCATVLCTTIQFFMTLTVGLVLRFYLEPTTIVSILFVIHLLCSSMALVFLIFCLLKKKFGTFYEVLLHAYLLSILLMALTALFSVMYLPLSYLQQAHSIGESVHYAVLLAAAAGLLALQFLQRNLVEQMLPVMEHSFH